MAFVTEVERIDKILKDVESSRNIDGIINGIRECHRSVRRLNKLQKKSTSSDERQHLLACIAHVNGVLWRFKMLQLHGNGLTTRIGTPRDVIESIRTSIKSSQLDAVTCGKLLIKCRQVIRNLNKIMKRAKSVPEKAHIAACLSEVKSYQRILQNNKVGGGTGVRRSETATHRVKWDDVNSAFESRIRTGVISNIRHTDPKLFLIDCAVIFKRRIRFILKKDEALKVNAVLAGEFHRNKDTILIEEIKYINTRNAPIYKETNLDQWFQRNVKEPLLNQLGDFAEKDSNWALSRIVNLTLNINKYNPLRVGSYIELPKSIARKRACINIKNYDDMCFGWAVVSALFPASTNSNHTSSYPDPQRVLNLTNIHFPMTTKQIPRFERQNNVSINVYKLKRKSDENYQIIPYFITENKQDIHVNLLLLQNTYISDDNVDNLIPIKFHYVWIKNLSHLLSSQLSKRKMKMFICDRCLHYYYTEEKLQNHTEDCIIINKGVVPQVPKSDKALIEFKSYGWKATVPFIIYADTECLLVPVDDDPTKKTQKYQKHVPFSVGYYVKCSYDDTLSFYRSHTGPDCMQWFVEELHQFASDLETVFLCPLPMEHLTPVEWKKFHSAPQCHICEKPFAIQDKKVRDHDHLTGKYRGPAHESCNLNFQDSRMVPVIFHNLSSYDGHMVIKALTKTDGRIDILPVNKEKYISFTKHIPESFIHFRFIDSFRFMAAGLDKLASYLEDYPVLKSHFSTLPEEQINLLTKKGVFPYDYMNGWESLTIPQLPPKHAFYNTLEKSHISDKAYSHAENVWKSFNCKSLHDYSELYIKTDILLLADVFEQFRSTSHKTYGIDPAWAYSLPGYAWQCMLYKSNQKLELLTDIDKVLFIEKGIRGGLSQCSKRYAEANNKYMPNYNQGKESSYLAFFDINNQYGWAMSQYLPYKDFKWMDNNDIKSFNVCLKADDAHDGYIIEADLEIPQEMHDKFIDLPPCPEHSKPLNSENMKLLATLFNKEKYVIHYRNLKQALTLGVKLTKIHRILCFKQAPWLKMYIDINTKLRQEAKNEFEKNLFKLMNNAVFGKTIENIRSRSIVKLITKWDGRYGAEAIISRPEFKSATIIDKNMIIVELAKTNVYFNKPIYVGMCILDIAKTTIYDFHYNYIKKKFYDCNVLYTDTDSLIYEIKHNDIYQIIREDCYSRFDTSDYSPDNIYNIPRVNHKVLGMVKDENNGRIMTHFAGLRSKMYATKVLYTQNELDLERIKLEKTVKEREDVEKSLSNLCVTKKIKGIKKSVIKYSITFEDYIECLTTFLEKSVTQYTITSQKHQLYTTRQTKIGLNPHDDKRLISKTSVNTLPWGHYSIV